jgi:hypothetical protein
MAQVLLSTVYRGDDQRIDFEAKWADGTAINLTGAKIWFGAVPGTVTKKNAAAGGAETQAAVTNPAGGLFSVYLLPGDTSSWAHNTDVEYDAVIEVATGERYTVGAGAFRVRARIAVVS